MTAATQAQQKLAPRASRGWSRQAASAVRADKQIRRQRCWQVSGGGISANDYNGFLPASTDSSSAPGDHFRTITVLLISSMIAVARRVLRRSPSCFHTFCLRWSEEWSHDCPVEPPVSPLVWGRQRFGLVIVEQVSRWFLTAPPPNSGKKENNSRSKLEP